MPRTSPAVPSAPGEPLRSTADYILDVAGDLFYRHGYAAVGVDLIVRESGVAKMTLYRHFASKDELIASWLERVDAQFWRSFECWAGPQATPPRERLLGVFAGLEKLVSTPQCLGCPFLVAGAEFPEPVTRAHEVARRHKERVRERLRSMAAQAGARNAEALGDRLLLLMDGAFMAARLFGLTDHPGRQVAGLSLGPHGARRGAVFVALRGARAPAELRALRPAGAALRAVPGPDARAPWRRCCAGSRPIPTTRRRGTASSTRTCWGPGDCRAWW